MESSKTPEQIIALGKQLVDSLNEPHRHAGPLQSWMAHYIAEQMSSCEQLHGAEREAAQKRCFDAILQLWVKRRSLPEGSRPFEELEPLIQAIQNFDSETPRWLRWMRGSADSETDHSTEAKRLAKQLEDADESARLLIRLMLESTVARTLDDASKRYLEFAPDCEDADIQLVSLLARDCSPSRDKKVKKETLISDVNRLDRLIAFAKAEKARIKKIERTTT